MSKAIFQPRFLGAFFNLINTHWNFDGLKLSEKELFEDLHFGRD